MNTQLARREGESTALADPSISKIANIVEMEDLVRWQVETTIHPVHQYEIPAGKAQIVGRDEHNEPIWETPKAVHITSDGYDYLNRMMGVQLVQPDMVPDETGTMVSNPIHRRDYVYVRLLGIWRNDVGQLVTYREDVEVDYQAVYRDARLNAVWYDADEWVNSSTGERSSTRKSGQGWSKLKGSKHTAAEFITFKRGADGMPVLDDQGNPTYELKLPNEAEVKALQTLFQLRRFGLRYAQTVAKTRILKAACGIRRLPKDRKEPQRVSIVAWRDLLSPAAREEQARRTEQGVWDSAIVPGGTQGLGDDEMQVLRETEAAGEDAVLGETAAATANVEDDSDLDEQIGWPKEGAEQTKAPFES